MQKQGMMRGAALEALGCRVKAKRTSLCVRTRAIVDPLHSHSHKLMPPRSKRWWLCYSRTLNTSRATWGSCGSSRENSWVIWSSVGDGGRGRGVGFQRCRACQGKG